MIHPLVQHQGAGSRSGKQFDPVAVLRLKRAVAILREVPGEFDSCTKGVFF